MPIAKISFIASFGNEDVNVEISSPNGAGGNTYHLIFNKRYQGIIVFRGEWKVLFQLYTDNYTSAEIDTLIEKLTEFKSVI